MQQGSNHFPLIKAYTLLLASYSETSPQQTLPEVRFEITTYMLVMSNFFFSTRLYFDRILDYVYRGAHRLSMILRLKVTLVLIYRTYQSQGVD